MKISNSLNSEDSFKTQPIKTIGFLLITMFLPYKFYDNGLLSSFERPFHLASQKGRKSLSFYMNKDEEYVILSAVDLGAALLGFSVNKTYFVNLWWKHVPTISGLVYCIQSVECRGNRRNKYMSSNLSTTLLLYCIKKSREPGVRLSLDPTQIWQNTTF